MGSSIQYVRMNIQPDGESETAWFNVNPEGPPESPYDTWSYEWDTTAFPYLDKQAYSITVETSDGEFRTYIQITVTIDQGTINHPPIVTSLNCPNEMIDT